MRRHPFALALNWQVQFTTQDSNLVEFSGDIVVPVRNEAGIQVQAPLTIPFSVVVTSSAVGVLEVSAVLYLN